MYTIRPAELTDINEIRRVAKETWEETYKNIYPNEFITKFLNKAYSYANVERSIIKDQEQEERKFLVATEGINEANKVIGYAHIREELAGVYELLRIYILPNCQGKGLGSRFLIEFKNRLKTLDKLKAWVESDHAAGRRFYDHKGFKIVQEKLETMEGFTTKLLCYEFNFKK